MVLVGTVGMAATAASVVLARRVVTEGEVEMGVLPAPTARAGMAATGATAGLPGLPRLLSTSRCCSSCATA